MKRYYIQAYTRYYYTGHGTFSDNKDNCYYWYTNPIWMLDENNPHALDSGYCTIVEEDYSEQYN